MEYVVSPRPHHFLYGGIRVVARRWRGLSIEKDADGRLRYVVTEHPKGLDDGEAFSSERGLASICLYPTLGEHGVGDGGSQLHLNEGRPQMVFVLGNVDLERDGGIWRLEVRAIGDGLSSAIGAIEFLYVERRGDLMGEVSRQTFGVYGYGLHGDIGDVVEVPTLMSVITFVTSEHRLLMGLEK